MLHYIILVNAELMKKSTQAPGVTPLEGKERICTLVSRHVFHLTDEVDNNIPFSVSKEERVVEISQTITEDCKMVAQKCNYTKNWTRWLNRDIYNLSFISPLRMINFHFSRRWN